MLRYVDRPPDFGPLDLSLRFHVMFHPWWKHFVMVDLETIKTEKTDRIVLVNAHYLRLKVRYATKGL